MNNNDLENIEKYLNNELTGIALKQFQERLANDSQFNKSVQKHQAAHNLLKQQILWDLMDIVEQPEPTYPFGERFQPVEDYETEIARQQVPQLAATRGTHHQTQVTSPQDRADCTQNALFTLQNPTTEALTLVIDDNQEDEIAQYNFPKNTDSLTIDTQAFTPGLYYWKLYGDQTDTIWGSFFIRK